MTRLDEFTEAQRAVALLAERELKDFFDSLNLSDNLKADVGALRAFMAALVTKYGEIGAALAAEFYAERRADAGVPGRFAGVMAAPIPAAQAAGSAGWAVAPLFNASGVPDVDQAVENLGLVTDRLVKQQYRDTIDLSTMRDPADAKWTRVPRGDTCSFCLMLASRGAVYATEASALGARRFHGKCDCTVTPVWDASDMDRLREEDGYDPDEVFSRWQDQVEAEEAAKASA